MCEYHTTCESDPATADTFDRIEQAIRSIRYGSTTPDSDDIPLRDQPVAITLQRDQYGDWRLLMTGPSGVSSANFGPRPGHIIAGLFDYLYEVGAGNWEAFKRETPR